MTSTKLDSALPPVTFGDGCDSDTLATMLGTWCVGVRLKDGTTVDGTITGPGDDVGTVGVAVWDEELVGPTGAYRDIPYDDIVTFYVY